MTEIWIYIHPVNLKFTIKDMQLCYEAIKITNLDGVTKCKIYISGIYMKYTVMPFYIAKIQKEKIEKSMKIYM